MTRLATRHGAGTALALGVLLTSVSACSVFTSSDRTVAIPTAAPPPADRPKVCAAAQMFGTLVSNERWGVALLWDFDGQVRKIIWPFGWSARREPDGLALLDASGTVLAHEGDRVEVDGGENEAGEWHTCGEPGLIQRTD